VSWGKVDPDRLPDAVVCYTDSTISLPLLTAYALSRHAPREPKRLYRRREEMLQRLKDEYAESSRNEAAQDRARHEHNDATLERVR
jgi:deoxyhypusine synthase